ncbi:MAG TPA: single-stranded DNA-binding protein [Planctomycetes bacterium]|nr:single-stranded DNA-binding protein [Planctomycetota bacterium]
MANINRVFLAGNLTRDPQVRFLANEKAVANFGLAINRRFKGADGSQKEETTFVDVEAWGRQAELVGQYLTKGRGCFIEGRLKLDSWEDKEGKKQSKLRVVADNVQFLDSKPRQAGAPGAADAGDAEGGDAHPAPAPRPSRPASPAPAAGDDEPPF